MRQPTVEGGEPAPVGKVTVPITVSNYTDRVLHESGIKAAHEVRSVSFEDALVDTGAFRLCLPADAIRALGLKQRGVVAVDTAAGRRKARVFADVELTVCGRTGTYSCLELPGGEHALLGVIPLEDLGLEPDLKNQKLKVLPDQGDETYLTM